MHRRLTAQGYRDTTCRIMGVVVRARGERCGTAKRGAAVGKSGLAQQSKGFLSKWTDHPNLRIIRRDFVMLFKTL